MHFTIILQFFLFYTITKKKYVRYVKVSIGKKTNEPVKSTFHQALGSLFLTG